MWFFKLIESFFKRERGEQGSGLMTVLGVSLVVTIAAGTITSSIVMASNLTSEKLSQQQADAAAEAGIADAVHIYQTGNCVASSPMHDSPKYKYNFYRSNSENYPTTKGETGTYAGCPGDSGEGSGSKADRWVMIESTGYGKNNMSKSKTAVFKLEPKNMTVIPQAITAKAAVFSNGTTIQKAAGNTSSNNAIYTQGFICIDSSNVVINANVKYESTNEWNSIENCKINGNIEGKIDNSKSSVDLKGIEVNGNACFNKTILNKQNVKSSRTSVNVPCNYEGTFYGYKPDLTESNVIKAKGNQCTAWSTAEDSIRGIIIAEYPEENKIIDFTDCDPVKLKNALGSTSTGKTIPIKSNVTLIFKDDINFNNINISNSGTKNLALNIVIPSSTADSEISSPPNENNYASIRIKNVNYLSGTSGVIYASSSGDGGITVENSSITGQIYSAALLGYANSTLNYSPVGLPNAEKTITEKKIKDIGRAPDLIRVY